MEGKAERLRQTVVILKKLTGDLGIPYTSPEVVALKDRLSMFVEDGEPWEGVISFERWERQAHVILNRSGSIEVTLKPIRKKRLM